MARSRLWKIQRAMHFWWQRRTRGWDDSDLWNLDNTLAQIIHPRLKRFEEMTCAHPHDMTDSAWRKELRTMIEAFEILASDDGLRSGDPIVQQGLDLFAKRYRGLWD